MSDNTPAHAGNLLTRHLCSSKPRSCQQRSIAASTDVIDAGIDEAGAGHFGQQRGIECLAIVLAQHHREVGALRVPCDFEIRAKLDLWRTVRSAYGNPPAAAARGALPTLREPAQQRLRDLLEGEASVIDHVMSARPLHPAGEPIEI